VLLRIQLVFLIRKQLAALSFQPRDVKKVEVKSEDEKPPKFDDDEDLTKVPKELELDDDRDLKEEVAVS
jgi:hypothetical protein